MPVQQIEASRDYFNYQATPLSSKTFEVPSPDDETLLRARSRGSSLERMPSPLARPGSRGSTRSRGSNRSLHSETNATQLSSRVTSWSDSSAGNTLTQRDIKRLTVIHESKDSISSNAERSISSGSLRRKTVPLPSFTTFKDPMPMESLLEETSTPVDPKRVFSALMKEIDSTKAQSSQPAPSESSPSAESDVFESSTTKELHAMASRELHSSASREFRTKQNKLYQIAGQSTYLDNTYSDPDRANIITSSGTDSRKGQPQARGQRTAEDTLLQTVVTPNAGQLEQRMLRSNERWKTPLDEHQHHGPLHHRSHARTISTSQFTDVAFRTPTTVVGIPALPELEGDSPKDTESQVTPVNTVSRSPRPNLVFSPLSPSIYSRNTDGISILPNDSVMSFDGTHDRQTNDDSGSAVIITSHAVKSYVIGTPSSRNKTESLRSSKDWKAWLSREVSELGSSLEGDITINDGYNPTIRNDSSTSGHHRELTQIEDDRTTIVARTSTDTRVHLPLSPTSSEGKDECGDKDRKLPTISHKGTPCDTDVNRKDEVVYTSDTKPEKRAMSPLVRTPAIRKDRHSSAHSHRSAKSRSSVSPPKSSTMNDRFPFIDTGRRTSINSARFSRSSRSATDSGSSTRSKCTPVSKVYSDVSAPVTVNWAPQPPLKTNSKEINESEQNKENIKGRVNPILTPATNLESLHSSAVFLSPLASEEDRPKSMLPLSSAKTDRSTPPLNDTVFRGVKRSAATANAHNSLVYLPQKAYNKAEKRV
ncbi:hypothetical protein SLS60_009058 [Paraconiothyrium brasiliense]|uniref:Proteophosphoglycan ppg4 n=1 Tax=Paraconiothyrium brasiliense TaxID=300254 RepID=A0ABR3QXA9_9PLEO